MRTRWHYFFKLAFCQLFPGEGPTIESERMGELPLEIDIVLILKEALPLKENRIFSFLEKLNIIEFKGPGDVFSLAKYNKLLAYGYLYCQKKEILPYKDMALWAIVFQAPQKLLRESGLNFEELFDGFYQERGRIPFDLVVINELRLEEENYPFLLFSTGDKRKRFIRGILKAQAENMTFLTIGYMLYKDEIKEVAEMEGVELLEWDTIIQKNIRELFDKLSDEDFRRFLEDLGKERVIKTLGEEEALQILLKRLGRKTLESLLREIIERSGE